MIRVNVSKERSIGSFRKDIVRSLNSSRRELNDILIKLKNAESNLNGIGKKRSRWIFNRGALGGAVAGGIAVGLGAFLGVGGAAAAGYSRSNARRRISICRTCRRSICRSSIRSRRRTC
ncbi:MAG: hypothetical protein SPJ62_09760 [Inconstantimicrobium porci]|uniref:hypothetical protein n=1 Tax=Inconstantimicrobium porci TaxID=2652291 RepID=UPI002A91B85D|nr:hypothetical protein [Inconstantimicrobium porci]MDY5912269.1 hypothetical protein [Inconstantimicrobium porci]